MCRSGLAPDLPEVDGPVDHVMMLDMLHLITDEELQLVLQRIYDKLENRRHAADPRNRSFGKKGSVEEMD